MRLRPLLLITLLGVSALAALSAQEPKNDRQARIVLLIPANAEPPARYEDRLRSLALRTEAFFAKWMKHWSYPIERSEIFARGEDGAVTITLVKADLGGASGRAALGKASGAAQSGATKKLGLKPKEEVIWWVFYDYPDIEGFRGGARGFGGSAINAYPPGEKLIPLDTPLATPELHDMAIKGTIHEFGHALGLPHIGPKPNLRLGNTLMGPVNKVYWQRSVRDDPNVYLSKASAAALWKHPVFRKSKTPSPPMPKGVEVTPLEIKEGPKSKTISVRGKISADTKAHSAVVYDTQRGRYGDYWARTYTGKIDPDTGEFTVVIDAPFGKGTFFLSFFFESGVNTADGAMRFQRGSPLEIAYKTRNGQRTFTSKQLPAAEKVPAQ